MRMVLRSSAVWTITERRSRAPAGDDRVRLWARVYDRAARSGPSCAVWSGGVPKGRRRADQAARAAASGKAGPPQPADPTRPAPRRQAPGLALRQDQDRSVPPCLKRSRAALPGAGRARPAPLRAGASRRAPPGRAPEPRPAPCEGDGQRRIHLSRKLAPAPQATAVLHRRRRTSPGQRCRSSSRRLASAPLGSGTARL